MTHTASLALSKELYHLSGWDYSSHEYLSPYDDSHPVYDLGYLLRKLPPEISIEKKYNHADGIVYYAEAMSEFESADTPEDAAAKLAIALFKQAVLRREAGPTP